MNAMDRALAYWRQVNATPATMPPGRHIEGRWRPDRLVCCCYRVRPEQLALHAKSATHVAALFGVGVRALQLRARQESPQHIEDRRRFARIKRRAMARAS